MRPKAWIAVVLLVMAVTLLVTWVEAQSRLRRGVIYDTTPMPLSEDTGFVLTGTLGPMVTSRIDAENLDLVVPLNSWVLKGQLIGEAESGTVSEQINQELRCIEDANAAIAGAKAKVREIDDELAAERDNARNIESELIERQLDQVERNAGRAPVVSPADGLLVASDVFPGTFGIASDAGLLCVHTHVRPADLASLRVGQSALIDTYGDPKVTLHAKVGEIAATPVNSPTGAAYAVTLYVNNPEGKRFTAASVRIRVQTTAK